MKEYSDIEILNGISNKDEKILEYLYDRYLPMIRFYITSNSGNEDDAWDIFQEAVVIILKKNKNKDLELTSSFKTYFYAICKNIWLKELSKRKFKAENYIEETELSYNLVDEKIEEYITDFKVRLFQRSFVKLSKDCQKVLILFFKKISLKDIAKIMGYKSEKYAKKRKYQCKERLVEIIQSDPLYKESILEDFNFD
ncbi:MAG TPA: sigma-70 family RNA polymerase sigma factor [Bacteroidales bacterium]|nr:sigma-70 family RNA polymerase sigma factor [Bacteroidales bacterium]